ncbi:ABC transporter ATP-binding protein [Corynebacterium lactis]|uniref:Iron ABC transporter ATP-binding protein n=1 Tax=Corynebacterium lactis RW2-5 TaxID=1408189 RepID=A0A0K2H0P5_9CORY|nr:ATP-binding cassette domain-containing protein [Corynebacterium lactis]ALA67513.1 iron ABC transporter ATP-binding protein [Corynebacterium lactis RW2-5]
MIRLENVRKNYTSEVEIGPVSLEFPNNAITALIGPNGAGKSTLLTMIGRLLGVDSGTINVGPYDVGAAKSKDLAKVLSILRQDNHFVTRLTVRQLVSFGRFPYSHGRLTAEDEEIISRYIEFLNLGALQGRYLDELSGGQRQRAYVAMVLCQETEYVLLDEPLNNLDISHSVDIMAHLRTAVRQMGRTMVVVLHDINFAARYADHICAVKDGQIVEHGPTRELMRSEVLSPIFGTQIDIVEGPHGPVACYGS